MKEKVEKVNNTYKDVRDSIVDVQMKDVKQKIEFEKSIGQENQTYDLAVEVNDTIESDSQKDLDENEPEMTFFTQHQQEQFMKICASLNKNGIKFDT